MAQSVYAHSKAGKADPRNKQVTDASLRERETLTELQATQKRLDALENNIKQRDQAAQDSQHAERYMGGVQKAIPTTPTLIGQLQAKNPGKARAELAVAALELAESIHGENLSGIAVDDLPEASEVIAYYEKVKRQDLEDREFDVDAML